MLDVRSAMRRAAQFNRDRPAVASDGRELTFGQAWQRGLRLANALIAAGLLPGDRVAVLEDNCIEAADFYIGSVAANLVRVPLYRRNSAEAHRHMILGTQCKAVVVAAEYAHELAQLGLAREGVLTIVRDGGYEAWLASFPDIEPEVSIGLDDIIIIRHSAGTTGKPKGIAFTHRAWTCSVRDWLYLLPPIERADKCLHVGPISHGSGYLFLPFWLAGACNVLDRKFEAAEFVDRVAREKISWFFAVPTIIAGVIEAAGGEPQSLPSLKVVMIAGAPISAPTLLGARTVFGDVLYQLYALTEATPVAFMGPKDWFRSLPGSDPLRSAGQIATFSAVEIRDAENKPLPVGEEGEIAVRCDGQMTGIWGDPELTARKLHEGWVLTGDVGRLDANGYLYIVDRVDDMIVSGGFNIWPSELEHVIAGLDGVREVVVFGVPHPKWGEAPHAVVVVRPDSDIAVSIIMESCAIALGSYKKPYSVELREAALPRNPVGKIQRKILREPYWRGEDLRVRGS